MVWIGLPFTMKPMVIVKEGLTGATVVVAMVAMATATAIGGTLKMTTKTTSLRVITLRLTSSLRVIVGSLSVAMVMAVLWGVLAMVVAVVVASGGEEWCGGGEEQW